MNFVDDNVEQTPWCYEAPLVLGDSLMGQGQGRGGGAAVIYVGNSQPKHR